MKVFVCYNTYDDTIEGVYTEEGMKKFQESLIGYAIKKRDSDINTTLASIQSIKTARQPIIDMSESLLTEEKALKSQERWAESKEVHKKRKAVLREMERLNHSIHQLETRWTRFLSMSTEELSHEYSDKFHFEEHYVQEG